MQVTVQLEDLETIIFATAAIKQIESILAAREHDPFVKPHLEYTQAHNNLVAVMNSAKRATADTLVAWDGELDKDEISFLKSVEFGPFVIRADYRLKHKEVDRLAAKGCIKLGQCVTGAMWAGESRADITPTTDFAVAITARGREKLIVLDLTKSEAAVERGSECL